jgi:uncharacterized membrane protein YfcA
LNVLVVQGSGLMFGVPVGELGVLALAIAGGGVLTGVLAGLFGIGGGGVIVPVLYEVFRALGVSEDIRMQLCVGTSLAIIVPTTFRSYFTHRAEGIGLHDVVRLWTIPAILGVVTGAGLAAVVPGAVFKVAFAIIAGLIATKLLFGGERWQLGKNLPGRGPMLFYGYLVGLCSSLMGVSGGSVSNMILTLYGTSIHAAVATSAGLGVPIAVAGTIRLHAGRLAPSGPDAAAVDRIRIDARLRADGADLELRRRLRREARPRHAAPHRRLEIIFGLFLATMSVRFIVSLL